MFERISGKWFSCVPRVIYWNSGLYVAVCRGAIVQIMNIVWRFAAWEASSPIFRFPSLPLGLVSRFLAFKDDLWNLPQDTRPMRSTLSPLLNWVAITMLGLSSCQLHTESSPKSSRALCCLFPAFLHRLFRYVLPKNDSTMLENWRFSCWITQYKILFVIHLCISSSSVLTYASMSRKLNFI